MAGSDHRTFLDRPAARIVALIVLLLCAASFAYLHRGSLAPASEETADLAETDSAAACIEMRFADIDQMIEDSVIEDPQAELFKQRAEAMCRDTKAGDAPSVPPPPGQ